MTENNKNQDEILISAGRRSIFSSGGSKAMVLPPPVAEFFGAQCFMTAHQNGDEIVLRLTKYKEVVHAGSA